MQLLQSLRKSRQGPGPAGRRAGWRAAVLHALWAAAGAAAQSLPPPVSSPAMTSPVPAAQVPWSVSVRGPGELDEQDFIALELAGRARPDLVLPQVQGMLAHPGLDGQRRLGLLRLLTLLQLELEQPELAHQALDRIRSEPLGEGVPSSDPQALASCLEATWALQGNAPLRQAQAELNLALGPRLERLPLTLTWPMRLSCLNVAASMAEGLGHFDVAVRHLQAALMLAETHGTWQPVLQQVRLGLLLHRAGQEPEGRDMLARALARIGDVDPPLVRHEIATARAIVASAPAQETEELQALREAIHWARVAGAPRAEALGLANLSDHHLKQRRWAEVCALHALVSGLNRTLPNAPALETAEINCGLARISQRQLALGMGMVRVHLDQFRRLDDLVSLSEGLHELARTLEQSGYLAEALNVYRQERDLARERRQRSHQRALLEAREDFEAERRQRTRELLTRDNQLKAEQTRQEALLWRQWAFVSLTLAGLLVLLGTRYLQTRGGQRRAVALHQRLQRQSETDPLTGLSNRRHFQRVLGEPAWLTTPPAGEGEAAEPAAGEAAQAASLAVGVLYLIDLDHFKQLNDRHGHAAGDTVLVETARRLRAVLREEDMIARWGGEEFLIVVRSGSAESADLLARRLLAALAAVPVVVGPGLHLTVSGSIGYARFPLAPDELPVSWNMAFDLIDAAMYVAKTQGRNRACGLRSVPAPSLDELAKQLRDLEAAWRDGRIALTEIHGPALPAQAEGAGA